MSTQQPDYAQVCRDRGQHEIYKKGDGTLFCRQCGAVLKPIALPRLSSRSTPPKLKGKST